MTSTSNLHSLAIVTSPQSEDAVAELFLRETGLTAIIVHSRVTGLSTVAVYLDPSSKSTTAGDRPSLPQLRKKLRVGLEAIRNCGLDIAPARLNFRRVPAEDWRESWKRHFKPLAIGRQLLIRASWHARRPVPGQAEIVLDPGLSFGTGQHPTTEFCLREIVRLRPRAGRANTPASLLDVGTGSGILAIAAVKLGYQPVAAFDFDPEAVEIARRNAAQNDSSESVRIDPGDVARLPLRPREKHAVVCANLTADLLQRHAARLAAHVLPGGHLVLAGILTEEFQTVTSVFQRHALHLVRSGGRREWRSGSFEKT